MAGEITVDVVNGIQKRVYDKSGLKNALPGSSIYSKRISWENGTRKEGENYTIGVVMRGPNGFTYSGSAGGVKTLKQARNMVIKPASITPFELDLREQLTWPAISRAASEGEGAFASLTGEVTKAMKFSASNRLEASILHGQRGYGTVEAVTDLGGGSADLTITQATWAPGMWWALGEGSTWDSFTSTTLNNASGPIIVSGIKSASRKITVTYTGTLASEVTAGDVLYPEGAYDGTTHYDMPGLLAQSENLTGTSLSLSAGTYANWKGNTHDVAGVFSWDIAEQCLGELRDRGASGKIAIVAPNLTYGELMSEPRIQRMLDESYSPTKVQIGSKEAEFNSKEYGQVELVNHLFMKQGEVHFICFDDCGRVGSSDLMFGSPGADDAPTWERVPNTNASEVVLYSDQCAILKIPSHAMVATGITH